MIFFSAAKLSSCVCYWGRVGKGRREVGKQIYFVFASRPIMENEKLSDWLTERIFIYPENYDNPHWANGQQHTHPPSPLHNPTLPAHSRNSVWQSLCLYICKFLISDDKGGREVRERESAVAGRAVPVLRSLLVFHKIHRKSTIVSDEVKRAAKKRNSSRKVEKCSN